MMRFAKCGFFAIFFFTFGLILSVYSQEIKSDWDEDSLETADETPTNLPKYDEAQVFVNGKVYPLGETLELLAGSKLSVKVERLKPFTKITVELQKAGQALSAKTFNANNEGKLELELTLPKEKISGTANFRYTASSGKKVELKTQIKIVK